IDDDGRTRDIKSEDVNDYLRRIAGDEFSAKDFRTWAGTVLAAVTLRQFARFATKAEAKKNVVSAIEQVAERLGNTPAVCRRCYVHPQVIDAYLDGSPILIDRSVKRSRRLSSEERAVLRFLKRKLKESGAKSESLEETLR